MIAQEELLLLNEANYGRKQAIKQIAEKIELDPQANVTIPLHNYLQALQIVVNDVDRLIEISNSMSNGLDMIYESFPSTPTENIIEALNKQPDAFFHPMPLVKTNSTD